MDIKKYAIMAAVVLATLYVAHRYLPDPSILGLS